MIIKDGINFECVLNFYRIYTLHLTAQITLHGPKISRF